jgi:hypothetical protein
VIAHVDAVLRGAQPFEVRQASSTARERVPWREIALVVVACGLVHGAAIGSFGLRAEQALYSALKLPILLALSTAFCLPNFYAVNTALGLREEFAAALRGVLATQATVAAMLTACSPLVLFWYVSSDSYRGAVFVNGLAFLLASLAGQVTLSRHYAPLVARNQRHRIARSAWLALYVFVTIQLAWVLRPFIGDPGMHATFLRPHAWSNAYVVLFNAFVLGR